MSGLHRLKYFAEIVAGQSPPSELVDDLHDGQPFMQGNAEFGAVSPNPRFECTDPPKIARAGDVLLSVRAPVGAVNVADRTYGIGRGLCAIRSLAMSHRYLYYWLSSQTELLESMATGSTFSAISASDVANLVVPSTDPVEQSEVADFLDRETAEIDAFIADQERLIKLLTERLSVAVSRAVTVWLDAGVWTPTGSPWIPMVHNSWRVLSLRRLGIVSESGTSVNGDACPVSNGEIGVLKTGAASKGYFDPTENKRVVDEDIARVTCPVRQGSLLVNRANSPELVGAAAFVDQAAPGLYLSDKLWQVTISDANPRFVYYWTRSSAYRQQLIALSVGASSSMQNLSMEDFLALDIAVPDLPTQNRVVDLLDDVTGQTSSTIADAHRAIELSRERRAALITAAVTGQIDVRTGDSRNVSGVRRTDQGTDRKASHV